MMTIELDRFVSNKTKILLLTASAPMIGPIVQIGYGHERRVFIAVVVCSQYV